MFICNFKINSKKVFKIVFIILLILVFIMCGIGIYRIFHNEENELPDLEKTLKGQVNVISASNYTNVLKAVHENIDNYVGMRINFTGYVYRVLDLTDTQFILARDMIISSDFQYVIVGFLCELDNAKDFKDETWVELTGEITKGDYHGDMLIIKVTEIKAVDKPNEEYVYPPDESYIPTSDIL